MAFKSGNPGCPCCDATDVGSSICCTCAWPESPTLQTPAGTITLAATTTRTPAGACVTRTWTGSIAVPVTGIGYTVIPPSGGFPGEVYLGDSTTKCCAQQPTAAGVATWTATVSCVRITSGTGPSGDFWRLESLFFACASCLWPFLNTPICPNDAVGIPVLDLPPLPPGAYDFRGCPNTYSGALAVPTIDLEPASSGCPPRCVTFQSRWPGVVGLVDIRFCP
jgi:hypothetical protein